MASKNKNIVVIGGGTGTYTVLSALKKHNVDLTAIVSMADDGGSTGKLRDEYGVLPPGDVRRSLVALSEEENVLRELFEYRFSRGLFKKHNFGNVFLTALSEITGGDFDSAVKTASAVLNVKGKVIPVTLDNVRLHAELEDGSVVKGESNIDIPKHNADLKIKKVFLKPTAKANGDAVNAVKEADAIVVGPGDLFTSVLPNFLPEGMAQAVEQSKAKKIYVCNLMTKHGETNNFTVKDFIEEVEKYIKPDYVLVNSKKPTGDIIKEYKKEKAELVTVPEGYEHAALVRKNLVTDKVLVRHDPEKLAQAILELL